MDTTLIRYILMSLDYCSAIMLTLIIVCSAFDKNKTKLLKIYLCMAASCTAALLLEAVSLTIALSNYQGVLGRIILNNVSVFCGYGLAFFYACYVANLVGSEQKFCKHIINSLRIIGALAVAFLIAGSVGKWFYTIENGLITPAPLFALLFAFDIIACLGGIILIIVYRKQLNPRDVVGLFTLPVFILLSGVLQYINLEMVYALFLMSGASVFIIYLMIQSDRNRREAEQETQLKDMNIAMMLSQIQPHFLYNALSSIRRMIKENPAVAERAVEQFSLYLRQNLDSMNKVEPIPFEEELNHVKEYLYLEKLRFEDRLNVEYDIAYTGFALPVLTLQPIVENAVKHGIMKKEEGGNITISAYRDGGTAVLTIEDDGVGFLAEEALSDEKVHIGFANVKRRIEMQCRGTVEVKSEIGVGSTVTITLPLI